MDARFKMTEHKHRICHILQIDHIDGKCQKHFFWNQTSINYAQKLALTEGTWLWKRVKYFVVLFCSSHCKMQNKKRLHVKILPFLKYVTCISHSDLFHWKRISTHKSEYTTEPKSTSVATIRVGWHKNMLQKRHIGQLYILRGNLSNSNYYHSHFLSDGRNLGFGKGNHWQEIPGW